MRLPVEAQIGRGRYALCTDDVGFEGMFLRSPTPSVRNQLVHVNLCLPEEAAILKLRGIVVRSVVPEESLQCGLPPGMGVHVYGLSESTRRRWYRFIERSQSELVRTCETATPLPVPFEDNPAGPTDKESIPALVFGPLKPPSGQEWTPLPGGVVTPAPRSILTPTPAELALNAHRLVQTARGHAWHAPFLHRISPAGPAELRRFQLEALSKEGIVLLDVPPDIDNTLAVVAVVHPLTGAEFHVPGKVKQGRAFADATVIRFLGVSKRTVEEFDYFASRGSPPPIDTDSEGESAEMVIYEEAHETQGDMGRAPTRVAEVRAYRGISGRTAASRTVPDSE